MLEMLIYFEIVAKTRFFFSDITSIAGARLDKNSICVHGKGSQVEAPFTAKI